MVDDSVHVYLHKQKTLWPDRSLLFMKIVHYLNERRGCVVTYLTINKTESILPLAHNRERTEIVSRFYRVVHLFALILNHFHASEK